MNFVRITRAERLIHQSALAALEKNARYPLGNDWFELDHGADYFAFFDRLGDLEYRAAVDGERVAGVGAGILRRVPFRQGETPRRAWYLCDLKVHPDFRGQRIPLRMLGRAFLPNYLRCRRGYAISMNPGDGSPNRVVKLMLRFRWAPLSVPALLEIYSLDAPRMRVTAPILEKHRGPVSYLSLAGKKELTLESTHAPLPLLHVQFGACAESGSPAPREGFTHMFCVPGGDPLALELASCGLALSATASILAHGMSKSDWRFVLTSDI